MGVSPPKLFCTGSELLLGTGMVMVMGLWNFLLRGSRVTMGLKVALFPRTFLTTSIFTGCAWKGVENINNLTLCYQYRELLSRLILDGLLTEM